MKVVLLFIFLIAVTIISLFLINEEEKPQKDRKVLHTAQKKFLDIDINDENLDLDKAIEEIKEARKIYPLDDKLKMVDIELEHKRANKPD